MDGGWLGLLLAIGGVEESALLRDFAIIMALAGAVVVVFRKLNQPPILGYLLAGLVVGPYTLPNPPVEDADIIHLLADLGLVLLLFTFSLLGDGVNDAFNPRAR